MGAPKDSSPTPSTQGTAPNQRPLRAAICQLRDKTAESVSRRYRCGPLPL